MGRSVDASCSPDCPESEAFRAIDWKNLRQAVVLFGMKRRSFLKQAAGAVAASPVFSTFAIGQSGPSANSKLNIAMVGFGGWIGQHAYNNGCGDENVVAFCDVDSALCAENLKAWQTRNQPFYQDFRVMFDKMHKEIDAVVISTPDHTHFAATMAAMEHGIHVYTQKPLAHNIWQVRTLAKARERYKLMTQMGNQGHAGPGIRKSVEAYRAGLIGEVGRVIAWTDSPLMGGTHYANPRKLPLPVSKVPDTLAWDLWLGPVAKRDFYEDYLPKKWRAFYDFGSGALGDWGCHTMDTPVWALDLDAPHTVECMNRLPAVDGVIPAASHLRFHFAAKGNRGPVVMDWYDGQQDLSTQARIDQFGLAHAAHLNRSCWMLGTKGAIGCGSHAGPPLIMPAELRKSWQANPPAETIPRVVGGPFVEWIKACKQEGPEPGSNYGYASKLTEITLLGVLAQRFNTRIDWDAAKGEITNHPELNAYIKEPAREGWSYGEDLWKGA